MSFFDITAKDVLSFGAELYRIDNDPYRSVGRGGLAPVPQQVTVVPQAKVTPSKDESGISGMTEALPWVIGGVVVLGVVIFALRR